LRLLAIVYTAAFSVAKFQNKGLIGDNGILPARNVLNDAESRGIANTSCVLSHTDIGILPARNVLNDAESRGIATRLRDRV